jgi:hypothetical protein
MWHKQININENVPNVQPRERIPPELICQNKIHFIINIDNTDNASGTYLRFDESGRVKIARINE